jgi:Fe-S-cluster-containing dehydrogenase component/DMSO reductase anchor subunit
MSPPEGGSLLDSLLVEQQQLTAVEQFARAHERQELPAGRSHYRRLLPAAPPASGQQYAFEVNLDKCSGCQACVTACHSLNGLDDGEAWRDVGVLVSEDWRQPFTQAVTTACHHCLDPACLNGCPVLAYEKDPVTGIVRHLDDQCIGCQYCILKCPYEVPKYSESRGIVRKCDLCSQRLAVGEAPACVQACPSEAIRITLVEAAEVRTLFQSTADGRSRGEREQGRKGEFPPAPFPPFSPAPSFLPASPDPRITLPTTRYVSTRGLPAHLLAGDDACVKPSASHLPLVFFLVLSQLAVGASASAVFADRPLPLLLLALIMVTIGLGIGLLHLGQPLKAWRSFLGWRQSWFSREIIVFSAFGPLMAAATALLSFGSILPDRSIALAITLAPAAVTGLLGVFCSAMIYADTKREFWSAPRSLGKFLGTTLVLGSATALFFSHSTAAAAVLVVAMAAKLAFEHRIFRHLQDEETSGRPPLSKTARLLAGELGPVARARIVCGLLGGVAAPLAVLLTSAPPAASAALALCFAGELLERYLFFTAVVTRRMPGNPAA